MNANELVQILEIGGAWEDDSGNLHNVPTGEFEQALSEAIAIIEHTRIRETATEPDCEWCRPELRFECCLIDDEGCTASIEFNMVQTVIAKFCPNCGRHLPEAHP